ncbi:hypothetical protein ACTXT7_000293 [Hymenolepis weldensis]
MEGSSCLAMLNRIMTLYPAELVAVGVAFRAIFFELNAEELCDSDENVSFIDTGNFTAQSSTVVGPLRDLTDGATPKSSKSDFASNVGRFFESRKMKVSKNPPPPPARILKVLRRQDNSKSIKLQKLAM